MTRIKPQKILLVRIQLVRWVNEAMFLAITSGPHRRTHSLTELCFFHTSSHYRLRDYKFVLMTAYNNAIHIEVVRWLQAVTTRRMTILNGSIQTPFFWTGCDRKLKLDERVRKGVPITAVLGLARNSETYLMKIFWTGGRKNFIFGGPMRDSSPNEAFPGRIEVLKRVNMITDPRTAGCRNLKFGGRFGKWLHVTVTPGSARSSPTGL